MSKALQVISILFSLIIFSGYAHANALPKIASGDSHTVALKSDGTVWAWGKNSDGQLGNASNTDSLMPVPVSSIGNITAIDAGFAHSVAVRRDGTVWTWGDNTYGQLGNGNTTDSNTPVQVTGLSGVVAAVAGYGHTLALKSDGTVWSWGLDDKGQLGNDTNYTNSNVPVQVNGLSGIIAIAGSRGNHGMALTNGGTAFTWGSNEMGQIGNASATLYNPVPHNVGLSNVIAISGSNTSSAALQTGNTVLAWGANNYGECGAPYLYVDSPYAIDLTGIIGTVSAISAGDSMTMLLINDGTVQGIGANFWAQLGHISSGNTYIPVPVYTESAMFSDGGVFALSAGANHTVAIKKDGTFWGWGYNNYGQVGNNSTATATLPAMSPKGSLIAPQVAAGYKHTIAVRNDGTVWAWGLNDNGQLGNGSGNSSSPVQVSGLSGIVSVAAGYNHSTVLRYDGKVLSWGANSQGQLGNTSFTPSSSPVEATGLTGVTAIASGRGNHTLALKRDGTVWAWGDNAFGQLGNNGAPTDRNFPVQAGTLTGVTAISASLGHSLALKSDNTFWAWGDNTYNQLGQASGTTRAVPTQATNAVSATNLYAGDYHTMYSKGDGTVWGMGRNNSGQLGNNSTSNSTAPVQASGISGIRAVAAGSTHTAIVKSDASAWGWGANLGGQLGNNSTSQSQVPVQALGMTSARTIAAGFEHTIAANADGTVWGWGLNDSGQLGNSSTTGSLTPVKTSNIVLNVHNPVTTATPPGGVYDTLQSVTLTASDAIAIYYTLDGTTPTNPPTGSTLTYATPLSISTTTVLTFIAVDIAGNIEPVKIETYTFAVPPVTTATPAGGSYGAPQSVTLTVDKPGSTIYYTTDGSTPTTTSNVYSSPLDIASNTTLKFFARDTLGLEESVKTETYTITIPPPVTTATPPGGTYLSVQNVTLTADKLGSTIFFTTDGSIPTTGSAAYITPITIAATTTLKFFARDSFGVQESVKTEIYTINLPPVTTATPAGGTYSSAQSVTLTADKPGSTIYYTTNGTTPTTGSPVYSTPITISATTTLKFFARDSGGLEESVKTESYTINIPPVTTATPPGGTYTSAQTVSLAADKPGSTIYYTTDGTTPTFPATGSTQTYSAPLAIDATTTLKFFARDSGGILETVKTETYTIRYQLSLTVLGGTNSFVHSTPAPDINCQGICSQTYDSGTLVQLTASPSGTDVFTGWSGACTGMGPCDITMDSAQSVTASFAATTYVAPQIASGYYHTIAMKSDGTLWAWGQNNVGQLGDGTGINSSIPVAVDTLTGLHTVKTVAAGFKHSIALKADGTVWAWGDNFYGQIGLGTLTLGNQYNSPAPISGLTGIIAVAAGEYHSLALQDDGSVWVWGRNNLGQLGTGDSNDRSAPYKLTSLNNIKAIAAGSSFSLALQDDGTVLAWGYNGYGQLGNMSYVSSQSPAPVTGLSGVASIVAGYNHSVALKGNGTVWAWGENLTGGLGNGTNTTSTSPVQVSSLTGVRSISAGNRFTTALKADGTVTAWGWNNWGQIGNSTNSDSRVPVPTSNLASITTLSSGYSHSTAIKSDGSIHSWGANLYGQLGNGTASDSNVPLAVAGFNSGATAAVTTPNPLGGTFTNALSVTLTASEAATIYYTVDGTTPTVGGPTTQIYTLPINISVTTTLNYFSVSLSARSEAIRTEVYTIDPIPVTTADPVAGTYTTVQNVTLTANKPGTIYYTVDGTTPTYPVGTTTTQIYSGPITIDVTTTLNYFTRSFDGYQETPKSQYYVINIPPVTTASPLGGTYASIQTVTLTMNKPGYIYFTIDGSTPTYPVSGTTQIYTGALTISTTTTLQYFARAFDGTLETVTSQTYVINIPPVTTPSPAGGTYAPGQTVTLTSSMPGTIYYTTDGTIPTFPVTGSTQSYSAPLTINVTTTLNYFARANDGTQETVKTQVYTISNLPFTTPTPPGGTYGPGQTVALASSKPGIIFFTTDGTTPTYPASGTTQTYGGPITINVTTTLKFFCRANDGNQEAVKTEVYTISNLPITSSTPPGGTYTAVQSVTLTANKPSTIYYTVDGTTPTSPVTGTTLIYSGPITVGTTSSLKFFGVDNANSSNIESVKTESYTINIPIPNQLTVVIQGGTASGSAVNTSPDPDINCTGYCIQDYFTGSEQVTLTASPSGWDVFVGWSGACTGTAPCTITMNVAKSVTATFAPIGTVIVEPDLAGGYFHSAAVKSDGSVWTWGGNGSGQLGLGVNDFFSRTAPVKVTPIRSAIAVATGDYHTLALRNDGTVWAWGANNYGQLGNANTTASPVPVLVKNLSGIIAIAAGAGHSLALKNDGTVWAWGNNNNGQLGDGTTDNRTVPVQVSGLSGMTAITAGFLHSVALSSNSTVWAWGSNSNGQLGNVLGTPQTTPAQVIGLSGVAAIAAGGYHTVTLKNDTTVWSWGKNDRGQLGNGSITQSTVPVQAISLTGVTSIAAGKSFTVALKSDLKVWMWGNDSTFSHPFVGSVNSTTPAEMTWITGVYKIAAGYFHTMTMKSSDTSVDAWGYNNYGQLGNGTTNVVVSPSQVLGLYLDASACYAKIGASCYASITEAYLAVPDNGIATILLQNRTYNEVLDFDRNLVDVTIEGGYDSSFSIIVGNATLNLYSMTVNAGSLALGKNVVTTIID